MLRLLLCLLTTSLAAQNFVSFPDSNAAWINSHYQYNFQGGNPIPYETLSYTEKFRLGNRDTLIAGETYHQLFSGNNPNQYLGGIKQIADAVWVLPKDSSRAYKIYDFGLQVGDTVKDCYVIYDFAQAPSIYKLSDIFNPVIIRSVDTIQTSLGMHRVLGLDNAYWIDGIGNSQGLFWDPFPNVSMFRISLDCFSVGDSIYYQKDDWDRPSPAIAGPCDMSLPMESKAQAQEWKLYPNPSTGKLTIDLKEPARIQIFAMDGQKVWSADLEASSQLDLAFLEPGIYLLQIGGETKRWQKL